MKRLLVVCAALLSWGCSQNEAVKDYSTIGLSNGLGKITLALPPELDTSYQYINYSDHRCAERKVYSIADKRFPPTDANSFEVPDSVYRLTITHINRSDCLATEKQSDEQILQQALIQAGQDYPKNGKQDREEIELINGRRFAIVLRENSFEGKQLVQLTAITTQNAHPININFLCVGRDCSGFGDRMYKSLKTIKLSN